MRAAKPAAAIFLIGVALLGITAFLAWDLHTPVVRDSTGGSRIVDELGLFAPHGVVVRLDRAQTDAYMAAELQDRRGNLLLCLGVGLVGLAIGSALIAWREAKEGYHRRVRAGF